MGAISKTVFKGIQTENYDPISTIKFNQTVFKGVVVEDWNNWSEINFIAKTVFKGIQTEYRKTNHPFLIHSK